MKFFTDKTVINKYLLVKITDYLKMKDFSRWECVFIDPCVYELTKSNEYSWINKIDIEKFLNSLHAGHFFSLDYPCDMNVKYTKLFLNKSWNNAIKYCKFSQYIITVQSEFNDYNSFISWFDRYNTLEIKSGILGLGNMCRILYFTDYIRDTLTYAFKNTKTKRIHIYGLGMRIIPFAYNLALKYNIELTIDSTKWTRAVNKELKWKYGYNAKQKDRQIFFDMYLKVIRSKGVKLEN